MFHLSISIEAIVLFCVVVTQVAFTAGGLADSIASQSSAILVRCRVRKGRLVLSGALLRASSLGLDALPLALHIAMAGLPVRLRRSSTGLSSNVRRQLATLGG